MIISHKYKFIFIKNEKTAGTSIEIALSKYLGEKDVITPIGINDEAMRKALGYRGPQNYYIPLIRYTRGNLLELVTRRRRIRFFNHAGAEYIKQHIDKHVWESYFKFCFERNPWDKVISWYYYLKKVENEPLSLSEYIKSVRVTGRRGTEKYSIDDHVVVDRVCKYEALDEEMATIATLLHLPETPQLPRAKGGFRTDRRHYREVLSQEERDIIAKAAASEIALFGYQW